MVIPVEERLCGYQHSRNAETTLHCTVLKEGLL
jgi:hypothetical protein